MKAPWDYSAPREGVPTRPNVPTPGGEALGRELARLTAPELKKAKDQFPNAPGPCNECAFVLGTEPNRCPSTLMDALKCVLEDEPFFCHKGIPESGDPKRLCAGFVAVLGSKARLTAAMKSEEPMASPSSSSPETREGLT